MREGEGRQSRRSAQPRKVNLRTRHGVSANETFKKLLKKAWHGITSMLQYI